MKRIGIMLMSTALLAGCGGGGSYGTISKSCTASQRSPGMAKCSCAQQVANDYLTGSDQDKISQMVGNPDLYDRYRSDRGFVTRLKKFGEAAEAYCA